MLLLTFKTRDRTPVTKLRKLKALWPDRIPPAATHFLFVFFPGMYITGIFLGFLLPPWRLLSSLSFACSSSFSRISNVPSVSAIPFLLCYILQAISPQDIGLGNRYHNQLAVDQLPLRLFRGDGVFEAGGTLRRPRLPSSLERPSPALAPPPVYSPHSRASHRAAADTPSCSTYHKGKPQYWGKKSIIRFS
ncbi:hypothetical protein C7M84_021570 [Penaeus vannamei]|uniref:Uncharacterized protein n=1 Tax=Penaeus vannamei TaxID=6689 RepID=A0A3R7MKA2_PENVA|nr:hypothetical protein C7M84_021570 [Penaeus vannamei]